MRNHREFSDELLELKLVVATQFESVVELLELKLVVSTQIRKRY